MEAINLDTPPSKKPRATATASHYSIDTTQGFTVNPYAKGLKNKINIVLHEGGVPPDDAQPHVTLLTGGMMLSIQWKAPKKLYTELQATAQKIRRDSSHFMGYSNTMQPMRNSGVTAVEGYHRGAPQIVHLDVKCTGDPNVMSWKVPTKVRVYYNKKEHIQFNTMYVCTLKVAKDRHGLQKQPEDAGIADFGFLRSQNSVSMERGGRAGKRVEVEDGSSGSSSEEDN
jgi:hypothetical protein